MKIFVSILLVFISTLLFAQKDSVTSSGIPVENVKTVKVKASALDSITVAKDYVVYNSNMTFWEKCKYWFFWLKKEQPFVFWPLLIMLGLWIIKMIFRLFDR
jgi:hypothetical protein